MTGLLVLGAVGLVLLLLSLLLGDVLDGVGLGALDSEFFSTAAIAGFIGALGFVGAIVQDLTGRLPVALAGGIIAGLAVGGAVGWATGRLKASGEGSAPSTSSLVGLEGHVVSALPAGGYGEVRVRAGGHPLKLNARCDTPLPEGTRVWVSGVISATAVEVQPLDSLEA